MAVENLSQNMNLMIDWPRTSTVVSFVQLPLFVNRNPHEFGLFQDVPQSANGALKKGRESHVGSQALLLDELTSFNDLFMALGRQRTIIPSSELEQVMTKR